MSGDSHHIHDFIRHLLSASANATLYGTGHPQVARLSSQAFSSICLLLETRRDVTLLVVEHELVIDGQPQDLTLLINRFTNILKSCGIGALKLLPGITKSEVDVLIDGFSRKADDDGKAMASSDHIRLGKVDLRVSGAPGCGSVRIEQERDHAARHAARRTGPFHGNL